MYIPSARASIITRRTYNRPLNEEGTVFETWDQTVERVIGHQKWLWERALGDSLVDNQKTELEELHGLMLERKCLPAGRTLWLGGTDVSKKREACQFNCSVTEVRTVHDLVDTFWLLLNGCGIGIKPINGSLSGFTRKVDISVVKSERTEKGGNENNTETYDQTTKTWTIQIGDSAEAWAKSIGKIVAGKFPAKTIVLDMSQIRPAGTRLKGYGWIGCGDRSLSEAYVAICGIMNRQAGKLLSKIDIMDIVNWLGTVLSSRRSAQLMGVDYGDSEWKAFALAKSKDFWKTNPQRQQSNNSLLFYEKPSRKHLKDIFDMMVENGGAEPGIINMEQARKRAPYCTLFNPCLVGEMRVAVADGRGSVSIKQLVDNEEDNIPVYCQNDEGNLTISKMIHPRQTGSNVQILKVTLDDGTTIRVTPNHKFLTRDERYVEARDLKPGDSLRLFHRYVPDKVSKESQSYADRYIGLSYRSKYHIEHRLLAKHRFNRDITENEHVHHIDGNRLNNSLNNFELKLAEDHLSEHSFGEANPTYCNITNEELLEIGCNYCEELGTPFSVNQWKDYAKENGYPQHFSAWRKANLGMVSEFSRKCAAAVGIKLPEAELGVQKNYSRLIAEGIDCEIVDRELYVLKICENCKKEFSAAYQQREQCYCTQACALAKVDQKKAKANAAIVHAKNREAKRERQINVFIELRNTLAREPQKQEWVAACKDSDVSSDMGKPGTSPFGNIKELIAAANNYNHKVLGVIEDGFADVYNGTVEDFHNFFVGGWESYTSAGRRRATYINNMQCGEIPLPSRGFCNLVDTDVAKFKNDHLGLHKAINIISRANYRQTAVNLRDGMLQDAWHQNNEFLRLCGVGLTGIIRRPDLTYYDYRQLRYTAISGAYSMANELGLERPKNVTTVKPSGTVAKCGDTTEGCHKPGGKYIFNNVGFSKHDPLIPRLLDANYKIWEHPTDKDAVLVALPIAWHDVDFDMVNGLAVNIESAVSQLNRYKMLQESWCDQNTSITVSYSPEEVPEMLDWFMKNWDSYTAVSFLFRNDMTKTAEDLGFPYLPQEVVTKEKYEAYESKLLPIQIDEIGTMDAPEDSTQECAGGACPIR